MYHPPNIEFFTAVAVSDDFGRLQSAPGQDNRSEMTPELFRAQTEAL